MSPARLLFLLLLAPSFALAQANEVNIPTITVLGETTKDSPLDFVPTVSELSGQRLDRKKESTLGETLAREPGVSSSQFGPNASRPVIRGLGGERIRILSNGTGVLDASSASEDHAVAIDPLSFERIEVIRGPATLLYGSSAVGGVVNVITNRIPEKATPGLGGKFESRGTTVDDGAMAGLGLNYGAVEKAAFHVDGTSRNSMDYKTSGAVPVENSFNTTWNGSVGGSYLLGNKGFLGASYDAYESEYGTVKEPSVHIRMKQRRFNVAGATPLEGWIQSLRVKNTYSDYHHEELELGEVGTTFKNRGDEARLEMKHRPLGDFEGLIGLQASAFDFEALGDEAFLPETRNTSAAAFLYEEARTGALRPSFGLRVEGNSVEAKVKDEDLAKFGASDTRTFTSTSASLGLLYGLSETDSLVLNLAATERAPNYQELFANGPHMATGIYEIGDREQAKEKAHSVELSWRRKSDSAQIRVNGFYQEFSNFISQNPRGDQVTTPDGDVLDVYTYTPVKAELFGAELEFRQELPALIPGGMAELEFKIDSVQGKNKDTGDFLPRMPPLRESVGLNYRHRGYTWDVAVERSEKQVLTAPNETGTDAFTLVNAGIEISPVEWDTADLNLFMRVHNMFDVEARNHVSFLKEIAPLPGRNFIVGVRSTF